MTDLRALIDEHDVVRGLNRFARILDSKTWDALGDVFAEDLTFDYGDGREQNGIAALRLQMTSFLDICGGSQHLLGSILVDVDRDRATSSAYVQARHQRRDDTVGPIFDANGEYMDQWERRAQGWRIVRRDVHWHMHAGDSAVLAVADIR